MQILAIYIYPIKSCKGISLDKSQVLPKGLQWDRRWMLVDADGECLTQREFPILSQVDVSLHDTGIEVSISDRQPCFFSFDSVSVGKMRVRIWDDDVWVARYEHAINEWFSRLLEMPCQLVFMPENGTRLVDKAYATSPHDQVSLADGYPLLLISQASLDALNARLEMPVPMNRFRPNIVVTGCDAFAEDTWREIQIGDIKFAVVKPCARCVITTINQETGESGKEPLKTLATFRQRDQKVLFGQNMIPLTTGLISVESPFEVLF